MSTTQQVTAVPTGTWVTDPVHSSLGFAVKHMVVATFRGSMTDFEATLTAGEDGRARLVGVGRVASVVLQDENLSAHVQSPDFFDAERYPEVRYESSDISIEDGRPRRARPDHAEGRHEAARAAGRARRPHRGPLRQHARSA